ncbi:hypothetical protein BD779DRAFT_519485 [Infundibulicybe gibba]|nr:hypothetical protein BD779DRAFT_519485 [Infundibulicybe gibba]
MPILDIVATPHDFSFVVMPRWGILPVFPGFSTVREALHLFESLLHGLSFLHEHRIVHRDISWGNILINHFNYNDPIPSTNSRIFLRGSQQRLSSHFALCGTLQYHPDDINHGEFDYDPFAFDVALMGNVLSSIHLLTPAIPLLAPLLDRMTTHVVEHRFTAAEAHKFCVAIKEGLSVAELNAALPPEASAVSTWPTDRWAQLSPEFVRAWSSHREIPPPFHLRLLEWITHWDPAFRFLRLVRAAFQV